MSSDDTNKSFCFEYMSKIPGIKSETIESLIKSDYDSVDALLAMDLDIDLDQLRDVSMGQKSVLRKALKLLAKVYAKDVTKDEESLLELTEQLREKRLKEKNHSMNHSLDESVLSIGANNESTSASNLELRAYSAIKSRKKVSTDNCNEVSIKPNERNKRFSIKTNTNKNEKKCGICGNSDKLKSFIGGNCCQPCHLFFCKYADNKPNFECDFDGNCLLTKKTRNGCRSCRWDKCSAVMAQELSSKQTIGNAFDKVIELDLNSATDSQSIVSQHFDEYMDNFTEEYQPSIELTPIRVNKVMNKKPKTKRKERPNSSDRPECTVCGDEAKRGIHFGALTCNGCATFFARVVSAQIVINECINSSGNCELTRDTRSNCRYCRYQACLSAGMTKTDKKRKCDNAEDEQPLAETDNNEVVLPNVCDESPTTGVNYASIFCGISPKPIQKR